VHLQGHVKISNTYWFLKFAARRDVAALHVVEQALGAPMKRFERPMLGFLSREEMLAVIGQPGLGWVSQRDCLLLALMYNTGARVSEVIGVKVSDVVLDAAACVHLRGKGRKERSVALDGQGDPGVAAAQRRSRANVGLAAQSGWRDHDSLQRHATAGVGSEGSYQHGAPAGQAFGLPSHLANTTAMHLLQSGVDISVIALWLGHESPTTTHQYVEADLAMKEKALARLQDPETPVRRFRATDSLLEFLKTP
jgi:integrase/recombinase XerD